MSTQKTIFLSAYRNVAARYFLYTDILKELVNDKNLRIVIFVKDSNIDYYKQYLTQDNVTVLPVRFNEALKILRSPIENFLYLVRLCLYAEKGTFINTSIPVWKVQNRIESKSRSLGALYKKFEFELTGIIASLGNKFFLLRKAILALESKLFQGELYDQYFQEYKPDLLIVSSLGHAIDSYMMRSAQRHNCKVMTAFHNWDNASSKGYKGFDPNEVVVWNQKMKEEVSAFHDIDEKKIHIQGIAHWDLYFNEEFKPRPKQKFLEAQGLLKDHKIIFFGVAAPQLWKKTLDIIEALMEKIKNDEFQSPTQLVVRLHPLYFQNVKKSGTIQLVGQYQKRIDELQAKYGNLITFKDPIVNVLDDDIDLPIEDLLNLAEILYHSDVLLTQYSTLLLEGPVFDLPTINVALYNFKNTEKPASFYEECFHIKEILKVGASQSAYTYDQLFKCIDAYLENPEKDKAERKMLVNQIFPENRGHAGKDIGKFILNSVYAA